MRTGAMLTVGVALAMAAGADPAMGNTPPWAPPETISASGGFGEVAVDAGGTVTAVWGTGASGRDSQAFIRSRGPGDQAFGPARPLAPPGSFSPQVAVGADGEAAVLVRQDDRSRCAPQGLGCHHALNVRLKPSGGRLGSPERLTADGVFDADVAVAGGQVVITWLDLRRGLFVVTGSLTGRLSPPRRLASPSEVEDAGGYRMAANSRGDVVVIWGARHGTGSNVRPMSAYRPSGEPFEPSRPIGADPTAAGVGGAVAIDGFGQATVALVMDGRTMLASRGRSGGWRYTPFVVEELPGLVAGEDGDLAALWLRPEQPPAENSLPRYEGVLSIRPKGGAFGAPRAQPIGQTDSVAFDVRGNLTHVWDGRDADDIFTTQIDRFGFADPPARLAPSEGRELQLADLAVGPEGASAALYHAIGRSATGELDIPLMAVYRRADTSRPALRVGGVQVSRSAVTATARCNEPCRVRASLVVTGRRKPARRHKGAAAASRGKSRTLNALTTASLRLEVSRTERRRLRRALRRRGGRIALQLSAVDAAGNKRSVRRPARVR